MQGQHESGDAIVRVTSTATTLSAARDVRSRSPGRHDSIHAVSRVPEEVATP